MRIGQSPQPTSPHCAMVLFVDRLQIPVLDHPDPPHGMLKHIEWDGWGFPGVGNTTVYLVYDPDDYLLTVAKNSRQWKIPWAIL